MGETAQYVTLKTIIDFYTDEAILPASSRRRLYAIGTRGVIDLTLDVIGVPTSRRICVDGNKTCQLPEDYIKWSKVGVLNSQGEVATLHHNSNLTTTGAGSPDRLSQNTGGYTTSFNQLSALYYLNFIDNEWGYYGHNLYGVSGNELASLGDFKVDEKCGVIILDNCFSEPYIILEYLAAPDENYEVPIQAQEALIAWLSWKDVNALAASRKVSIYDKTERKRAYFREKNLARDRIKAFRIQDAIDASQRAIRLVPKG